MKLDELDPDFFARSGAYTKKFHRDVYPAIDPSSPSLSQHGKIVIITGAGSGFGARGIVPAFAKSGARGLVLVGRRSDRVKESAATVAKHFPNVDVLEHPSDVSDPKAVEALFAAIKTKFGGAADVLINNAGVQSGPAPIGGSDVTTWWTDVEINTRGTYLVTRMFLKELGDQKPGSIINLSSGASNIILPGMSSYGISKLAVNRYAEYLTVENPNVTCVTLDPGTVNTDMVPDFMAKFAKDTPELVGGACVWLSTEAASFLKGRFVMANWDFEELVARKAEISSGNDLKMTMQGKFGIAS